MKLIEISQSRGLFCPSAWRLFPNAHQDHLNKLFEKVSLFFLHRLIKNRIFSFLNDISFTLKLIETGLIEYLLKRLVIFSLHTM